MVKAQILPSHCPWRENSSMSVHVFQLWVPIWILLSTPFYRSGTKWWGSTHPLLQPLCRSQGQVLHMRPCNVKMISQYYKLPQNSVLLCSMFQGKWCADSSLPVNNLWCFIRMETPHQIGHGAICWCPGDVIYSICCQWISNQVPGTGVRIPCKAGSGSLHTSAF